MRAPEAPSKPGDVEPRPALGLFQGFGVEIEYMIVDRESLDVRPVADDLMAAQAGEAVAELERGAMAWSNELALHVLELKTNGPAPSLQGLHPRFHAEVRAAERLLEPLGCRLLPGGAHPWMDPDRETRLWPHEYTQVYRTFDRIFRCRGHGWSNLQSTHLNLPFSGPEEFTALHAAIRAVLPLLPALAASTPVLDGRLQGVLDSRLVRYAGNAERIPSVTGRVIPEAVTSPEAYHDEILNPMYRHLAPLDPEGVLRHEWVNARGAIARFDRGSVEVRVVDVQESPRADLAVAALYGEVLRRAVSHARAEPRPFHLLSTEELATLLWRTVRVGEEATGIPPLLLEALELPPGTGAGRTPVTAGEVWEALAERVGTGPGEPLEEWREPLHVVLREGPLARRILRALGEEDSVRQGPRDPEPPPPGRAPSFPPGRILDRDRLREVWRSLGDCLRRNEEFRP
jgi:glutamate---cysteine ligase / carboxylate-amine ligase